MQHSKAWDGGYPILLIKRKNKTKFILQKIKLNYGTNFISWSNNQIKMYFQVNVQVWVEVENNTQMTAVD